MATAKSLKKLRSVSNAFLEDGGSLLHGVDSLLRDLQQSLVDLQRREEILVERELALEARETSLNAIIQQLADNVSSAVQSPSVASVALEPCKPQVVEVVEAAPPETKIEIEVAQIQSAVAGAVSPVKPAEAPVATIKTATSVPHQQTSNHRKKRRR